MDVGSFLFVFAIAQINGPGEDVISRFVIMQAGHKHSSSPLLASASKTRGCSTSAA